MIGGSGTPRSLSTSSTILDDADEPLDSTDPPNPMDIMRGSMHVPGRLNAYFVERRYLNMPNPAFREELPMTEAQAAVFKDFHISRLAIRDTPGHPAVHVDFLVPKRIFGGDNISNCPVHVRFHGGGFCTGAATFKTWFALHVRNLTLDQGAITLMPGYRLMPESHGEELLDDINAFWGWYQSPKFYSDLQSLFLKFCDRDSAAMVRINRSQLLVSGDSAGGFLTAYSWLSRPHLRIKALYLQYPMLRAYTRNAGQPYRGVVIPESDVQEFAELYCDHVLDLKERGRLSPRTDSIPPEGMDMAYILSSAKKEVVIAGKTTKISYWKWWFRQPDILDRLEDLVYGVGNQNASFAEDDSMHADPGGPARTVLSDIKQTDGFVLPRARHPRPSYCPAIFISHGMADVNCPYQDSVVFAALVKRLFPDAVVRLALRPDQVHGFDYTLDEWELEQRWLLQLCMGIASAWVPGDEEETSAVESCRESTASASVAPSSSVSERSARDAGVGEANEE